MFDSIAVQKETSLEIPESDHAQEPAPLGSSRVIDRFEHPTPWGRSHTP
jgi:hypothetical protein